MENDTLMMRTILAFASAALITAFAFSPSQGQEGRQGGEPGAVQKKGQGAGRLAGTWKIASGKNGQEEIPEDRLGGRVVIEPGKMTIYDTEDSELYAIEFEAESRGQAQQANTQGRGQGRRITMKTVRSSREDAAGSTARGLIRLQDGKLMLIYETSEDGDFPSGFEPQGDSQNMFVLERAEEADSVEEPEAKPEEKPEAKEEPKEEPKPEGDPEAGSPSRR